MASFQDRIVGAAKAQPSTFAEVMADPSALTQAAVIVAVGAISGALGNLFRWGMIGGVTSVILSPVTSLIGWVVGGAVLWVVGTKVITGARTTTDLPQTLRTIGFAQVPMLAGILAVIPILGPLVSLVLALYAFYLALIATRELFGYPDLVKAFLAVLIAAVVMFVTFMILAVMGLGAGMVGAGLR
jgi:hypothetical protein